MQYFEDNNQIHVKWELMMFWHVKRFPKLRGFVPFIYNSIKILLLCDWFKSWWAKNTFGTHMIFFSWKRSFYVYKIIFSGWIVEHGDFNFLSLKISYIGGIRRLTSKPCFLNRFLLVYEYDSLTQCAHCLLFCVLSKSHFRQNIEVTRFWHDSDDITLERTCC